MSVHTFYTVDCDEPDCFACFDAGATSARQARVWAAAEHWGRKRRPDGVVDLCPEHLNAD